MYDDAERSRLALTARYRAAADANPGPGLLASSQRGNLQGVLGRDQSMVGHDRQYRHNTGWVYACVRAIAQRIAGQPVRLARRKQGAQGGTSVGRLTAKSPTLGQLPKGLQEVQSNLELIESHPLLDAIDDPNALMVRWTLLFVTAASLELTGKAYWWLFNERRDRQGKWTILPLPASWVRPKHGEKTLFAAWEIQVAEGVQPIEVPAEEIAYLYYPDPANPLAALSPLQANARAVVADEAMAEAQRRSFAQGPWPGLAITMARNVGPQGTEGTRPILTAEQRGQILAAVKAAYAGVAAFDEPIILDGLIERVDRLSNSPREMDFTNSGKYSKSRITQGFGVNPIVLGEIEGANRASAAAADDHFCFAPDTLILTTAGVKAIADVVPGDEVLTHHGRWRPVLRTMRRHYQGSVRRLRFVGVNDSVVATPSHPFLVGMEWVPARRLRPTSGRRVGDRCVWPGFAGVPVVTDYSIAFAAGRGVKGQDGWKTLTIRPNEDFACFMGLYAAEGHTSQGYIGFSCHDSEEFLVRQRISAAIGNFTSTGPFVADRRGNGVEVHQTGAGLARWATATFGRGAGDKVIPLAVWHWPMPLRRAFLRGYLDGDGYEGMQRSGTPYVGFNTVSAHLGYGVRQLLRELGFRCALKRKVLTKLPVICGKQTVSARPIFTGHISGFDRAEVVNTHGTGRTDLTVRENSEEEYAGTVCNLEVADDNSYTLAAGPVVHNCNHTINPKLELLSQCLTAWVGPLFAADGESLMVWVEPAVASDPDLAMNEERVLMAYGGIKINELRQRHNLGPVKGGEFAWVPATLVPVDLDDPQGPVAAHESAAAASGAGGGFGEPPAQDGQGDGQDGQQGDQGQEGVPVPDEEVRAGQAGRFRYPG